MSTKKPTSIQSTEDIVALVADTPFASLQVTPVFGGWGNTVYRLHLQVPLEGRQTLILKHFPAPFDVPGVLHLSAADRRTYEVAGLRFAHGLVPASAFVSVPKVHMEDPERNFYIVDDCGSDVKTLKQLMIDHVLPNDQAHAVGVGLATFIATVHGKGSEVLSEDAKAYKLFGTNKAGRDIAAWRYYGRLLNVLEGAGDFTGNGLIGLPLKTPLNDLERLGSIAASMNKEVLAEHPTLTMGDFWTGNILVNFSNDAGKVTVNKMWVVDWEIAQTGITGLDVGQMMGEMYFLRHFLPRNEEPIGQLRAGFFSTYKEKYGMDEEMVKRVAAHVGSHLITIGSTVKWGTEDETRGVVQDGVEYVLKAHSDDSAWLKACFVGGLL